MATKKVPALRLTLGGAPLTWHSVNGLIGFYHPEIPTPVGGPGECSLELAEQAAAADGAPVELIDITAAQAERARTAVAEHAEAVRQARGADAHITQQQQDATSEALGETTSNPDQED